MIDGYTLFIECMPPPNTRFRAMFYDESGTTDFICDQFGRFFYADRQAEEILNPEHWFELAGYMCWKSIENNHAPVIATTKKAWNIKS